MIGIVRKAVSQDGYKKLFSLPSREHKIIALYFFICAVILVHFLPQSWGNDAITVLGIASGAIESEDAGSYYLTALVFGALGDLSILFILIVGYLWAGELSFYSTNKISLSLILFCTAPGVLMGLVRPQKDVFVGIVVFFILYILRRFSGEPKKIFIGWAIVYSGYAVAMRPYFLLIFILFSLILIVRKYFRLWFLVFIAIIFLSSFALSQEQMLMLQGSRDAVNFIRGVDEEQRTAFANVYPYVDSTLEFWINYLHAFTYLNFPIAFFFDFQSIALQLSVTVYILLLAQCFLRKFDEMDQSLGLLFLAHFLFLPLFEPDLGSYARHISIAAAYLAPAIVIISQKNKCE